MIYINFNINSKGGEAMPCSNLWAVLTYLKEQGSQALESKVIRATDPLQEYVPGIAEGEIITGTEIKATKFLGDDACFIEINGRETMVTEKEASKIYVVWDL
jgi:hypothetical protein